MAIFTSHASCACLNTPRTIRIDAPAALVAQRPLRPHELASLLEGVRQRDRRAIKQLDVTDQYIASRRSLETLAQPHIRALSTPQLTLMPGQLGLARGPLCVDLG